MKNRTMTTSIGTISLADITLAEDTFCIFIPIVEVSDGLKATVEENIQKAKDEWQKECLDERGKKWSDKGINVITQDLCITVGEKRGKKVFDCDLSYTFEDAENPIIWHGFSLEVDLSEHIEELKNLVIKAMTEKFF
ncbi:MAG: hypothetical protein J6J03_04200 [Tyzzerella sp.]|nr:hypothetical protein [Tyzzerella sp.]